MIQPRSLIVVADNSGAKIARVFKVLGGSKRRYARLGDLVVVSIQSAEPRKAVKKGEVHRAIVVRQVDTYGRKDGSYIRFDENAVVLVDAKNEPKAGRVFGPIPREIAERGFQSIISKAPEVV